MVTILLCHISLIDDASDVMVNSDRLLGGGDEAYYTYVEEADDDANKGSA